MFEKIKKGWHELVDITPEEEAEFERASLPILPPNLKKVILPRRVYRLRVLMYIILGILIGLFFVSFHFGTKPPHVAKDSVTVICCYQHATVPAGYIIEGTAYKIMYVGPSVQLKTPYKTSKEIRISSDECSAVVIYPVDYLKDNPLIDKQQFEKTKNTILNTFY